jgi:hypothetical protein
MQSGGLRALQVRRHHLQRDDIVGSMVTIGTGAAPWCLMCGGPRPRPPWMSAATFVPRTGEHGSASSHQHLVTLCGFSTPDQCRRWAVHLLAESLRARLRADAGKETVPTMRLNHGLIALMLSATALASASAMTGCAGRAQFYDSYGHDYHRWDHDEDGYYRRWESEGGRGHMDFQRRSPEEQHAYWGWRQSSHGDSRSRH